MCGNVWQEHTINEVDGCMALMKLIFQAHASSANLQGEALEICPVCKRLPGEHTDADLISCVGKWRKREQGATGLELQHRFLELQSDNEEPDPVKRAQSRARALQLLCSCGKAYGDHIQNEIRACAEKNRSSRGRIV